MKNLDISLTNWGQVALNPLSEPMLICSQLVIYEQTSMKKWNSNNNSKRSCQKDVVKNTICKMATIISDINVLINDVNLHNIYQYRAFYHIKIIPQFWFYSTNIILPIV